MTPMGAISGAPSSSDQRDHSPRLACPASLKQGSS